MQGKTVVITGATSGIGEIAALALAGMGARIVMVARDKARAGATLTKLKGVNPSAEHRAHYGDLSAMSDMRRIGHEIAEREPAIDVLINNAGAVFTERKLSADGLEMTFATNHMSYFVLSALLADRLKATPGARVVSTASEAYKAGKLDFDNLQSEKSYSTFRAYGTSKLENILFTRELSRRLAPSGVTANCLHPGGVATRFGSNNSGVLASIFGVLIKIVGISPEKGARTIIYLASSPDVTGKSGGYYYKKALVTPGPAAQNDENAKRLWDVSSKIAGIP